LIQASLKRAGELLIDVNRPVVYWLFFMTYFSSVEIWDPEKMSSNLSLEMVTLRRREPFGRPFILQSEALLRVDRSGQASFVVNQRLIRNIEHAQGNPDLGNEADQRAHKQKHRDDER